MAKYVNKSSMYLCQISEMNLYYNLLIKSYYINVLFKLINKIGEICIETLVLLNSEGS